MSDADSADLIPGETLLLVCNRHPVVLLAALWMPLLLALAILVVDLLLKPTGTAGAVAWYLVIASLLGALLYATLKLIAWRAETYTLTDQRVILKRGVVSRYARSISMSRVQDVTTRQGLLGRMLDYGSVEVESAGRDGAELLVFVPRPGHFRNVLLERLHPELAQGQ